MVAKDVNHGGSSRVRRSWSRRGFVSGSSPPSRTLPSKAISSDAFSGGTQETEAVGAVQRDTVS